jgi:energy-converting hydrogenase A subunit E
MKYERINLNLRRKNSLLEVYIWFYAGCTLVIVGSLATVIGPGVKDPLVRTLNTEIPAVGLSLIFLTYNHTIALLTFIAATSIITLILLRTIVRLEEMGAEL